MSSNIFDLLNEQEAPVEAPVEESVEAPEKEGVAMYLKNGEVTTIGSSKKHINNPISKLILINCIDLRSITFDCSYLTYIEIVNCPKLKNLPKDCPKIKTLIIKGTTGVRRIPETYTTLEQIVLHNSDMISFPTEISSGIVSIDIDECHGLTSIGGDNYTSLTMVSAKSCINLSDIKSTNKIKHIYIEDCPATHCIPKGNFDTLFIKNCPLVWSNLNQ
jgi:hypothetical protein